MFKICFKITKKILEKITFKMYLKIKFKIYLNGYIISNGQKIFENNGKIFNSLFRISFKVYLKIAVKTCFKIKVK